MVKWIFRILLVSIISVVGLFTFTSYRSGYFNLPDMKDGSYAITFKNGFRAIVVDADITSHSLDSAPKFFRRLAGGIKGRKFIGVPVHIAPWFKDAWSFCNAPSKEEKAVHQQTMSDELAGLLEHAQLYSVCYLDVEGKKVLRGLIYTVPKL